MEKKFESEIRIVIKDINMLLKKLEELGATISHIYNFNDYIYVPTNSTSNWNPNFKIMRIREHISPETHSRILFTETDIIEGKIFQFKQSKYPEGKIELYRGNQETAEALLQAWDFKLLFKIEKTEGKLYEVEVPLKFIIAVEAIAQLGYSAEIEMWGENLEEIEQGFLKILTLLEIPRDVVTSNTLPYIMAKHLNLLKFIQTSSI